jgi:hypothetical protein
MRIEGAGNWIVGFALLPKPESAIISPDPKKGVTRHYLLETVGPEAAAAGYKAGDIVVAERVYDTFPMHQHRVSITCDKIMYWVRDVPLSAFTDLQGKPFSVAVPNRANGDTVAGAPV